MNAIETLISVLCDPEGKCCISGSDDDRRLIDSALAELAQAAQPTPAQADSVTAPDLDIAVMQLAESVGLIGPASRVGDLHAAIQRFHDLICVDATIKAAVMAADVIRGAATSVRDYPPLPMQFACSGVFPVYSADQMRAYVDADRAARAPADSVLEDAARYRWLADYLVCDRTDVDDAILACSTAVELSAVINAARKQGGV